MTKKELINDLICFGGIVERTRLEIEIHYPEFYYIPNCKDLALKVFDKILKEDVPNENMNYEDSLAYIKSKVKEVKMEMNNNE